MAQIPGGGFNAEDHGEMRSGSCIPEGPKMLRITESSMHPTKANTGEFLELVMEVLTPEFAGFKHTLRLNLNNPNAQAVDIANRELGAICRACGKPVIQDSVELHGIPFVAEFIVDPATPAVEATATTKARRAYGPSNRIVGYEAASGHSAAPAGTPQPTPPPAAPASATAETPAPGPQAQPPAPTENPVPATEPAAAEAGEKPPWA